jgi:hypothetical protein
MLRRIHLAALTLGQRRRGLRIVSSRYGRERQKLRESPEIIEEFGR